MAIFERLRCPACGYDRRREGFGLTPDGDFDAANAQENEGSVRVDRIGGRGRLTVERLPLPLRFALGMRDMLRFRLARLEAEIRAAGVALPEDDDGIEHEA